MINDIQSKNILVIGDIMLDTYFKGDVERISPEAPVPVFRKKDEKSVLGGAANVAANLVAAGQNVSMMAIAGDDEAWKKIKRIFEKQGINTNLIFSFNRCTTEKTRFLASNNQQILRLDVEDARPLGKEECEKLLVEFERKISSFDFIIISDYMKGFLTYSFTQGIIARARENQIPVIIDVKDSKSEKYAGAMLLKPNLKELRDLTGRTPETEDEIVVASEELRKMLNVKYVLTTCGGEGMMLVGDGEPYFIEAFGQEVYDVTGAGDTAIAYLGACMANGFSIREAVDVANLAAGIQVSKVGTSSVYWTEIVERLIGGTGGTVHKLISGKAVDNFRRNHEEQKVVFTNGCFDILHIGHIRYLEEARKLGDLLVVGLNSDASVKRLKDSKRPINNEIERAEMLSALGFVNYVVIFEEDTPLELINKIQPDILVKGGDYAPDEVIGKKEVEERGGKLVLIPFVEGKSTTGIIEKIKKQGCNGRIDEEIDKGANPGKHQC